MWHSAPHLAPHSRHRPHRLCELEVRGMDGLLPASLARVAGSLRALEAIEANVDDEAVGALTGLRRLRMERCGGVSVDAVRRLPMVRHLDVAVYKGDSVAVVAGWLRVASREGEEALRADMPLLEDVRVVVE